MVFRTLARGVHSPMKLGAAGLEQIKAIPGMYPSCKRPENLSRSQESGTQYGGCRLMLDHKTPKTERSCIEALSRNLYGGSAGAGRGAGCRRGSGVALAQFVPQRAQVARAREPWWVAPWWGCPLGGLSLGGLSLRHKGNAQTRQLR